VTGESILSIGVFLGVKFSLYLSLRPHVILGLPKGNFPSFHSDLGVKLFKSTSQYIEHSFKMRHILTHIICF
jgi:hypothetical protein